MVIKRELKNIMFFYDPVTKHFTIARKGTRTNEALTKAEAGAFSRFFLSMIQYHSSIRKHKKSTALEKGVKQHASA